MLNINVVYCIGSVEYKKVGQNKYYLHILHNHA